MHVYVADALVYDGYGYRFSFDIDKFFDADTVRMGVDYGKYGSKFVDDVMIVAGAVDPEKLKEYYNA